MKHKDFRNVANHVWDFEYVCFQTLGSMTCTQYSYDLNVYRTSRCLNCRMSGFTKQTCAFWNIRIFDMHKVMSCVRNIYVCETFESLTCAKSCLTNEVWMFAKHQDLWHAQTYVFLTKYVFLYFFETLWSLICAKSYLTYEICMLAKP